ncbi:hypothetical protein CEXT_96591 [Caerostris extrusa]|uniref:Uncharacterized protein n=1 Tax=Caerostris extrusa TaxID=172846 RepID=A0AAV4XML3_CAEEX|nr:hypothetical protein CEXT_96591 [Caerostris extrusa]
MLDIRSGKLHSGTLERGNRNRSGRWGCFLHGSFSLEEDGMQEGRYSIQNEGRGVSLLSLMFIGCVPLFTRFVVWWVWSVVTEMGRRL